jgi:hypothetical protein
MILINGKRILRKGMILIGLIIVTIIGVMAMNLFDKYPFKGIIK